MDKIDKIIRETLINSIDNVLNEGIDIDTTNKIVSFNNTHQDNVDTNDYIHPYIISNTIRNNNVLSIFERKDNDEGNDGNPLVYALKNIRGWRFANPKQDIMALLRRFIAVTKELNENFDVIITTPSNNPLNNRIFDIVERIIPHEIAIKNFFKKYDANFVFDYMIDEDLIAQMTNTEEEYKDCKKEIERSIMKMNRKNNGVFSYKYIEEKYRKYVIQSMYISNEVKSNLELANVINGKRVIVLDDTVTSGKTISASAEALMETFDPKDITFLTLFSPKSSQGFENIRTSL